MAKRKTSKAKASRPVKRAKASRSDALADSEFVDPVPRPSTSLDDPCFLDQQLMGRWLDFTSLLPGFTVPPEVEAAIERLAHYIALRDAVRIFGSKPTMEQVTELRHALSISYSRGYFLAVLRYEDELKDVPELASWRCSRKAGGDKGRKELQRKTEQRYQEIRDKWAEMEANGEQPTNESVARAMECGRSTVIRAFKSKPKR